MRVLVGAHLRGEAHPRKEAPRSALSTAYRTHACGEVDEALVGREVTLAGLADVLSGAETFRLRDASGDVLCVTGPSAPAAVHERLGVLEGAAFLQVVGEVVARGSDVSGVYVKPRSVAILSASEPLPPGFEEGESPAEPEALQYRTLLLRQPELFGRVVLRSLLLAEVRRFFAEESFCEVETPLLGGWSEEQTLSYLVPAGGSRVYALPGTTQLHKQLLIAGGVDRYFQVARCFRREPELTPERQPEYSVLDVEMAFAGEEELLGLTERLLARLWREVLGEELALPLLRLTYHEAMLRYGTDRPDLRFEMQIADVKRHVSGVEGFEDAVGAGGGARALRLPQAALELADGALDRALAGHADLGDLVAVWAAIGDRGGPVGESADRVPSAVVEQVEAKPGDVVVLVGARYAISAARLLGRVRASLGPELANLEAARHSVLWIHRFPFFELDPLGETWEPKRHPFTQPIAQHSGWLDDEERRHRILTHGFDLVVDGVELGAGSVRNHDAGLQRRLFAMFGYPEEEVERRFGTALRACGHGVPPHAGLAIGFDRLAALLGGTASLREALAFPKSADGEDGVVGGPSPTTPVLRTRAMRAPAWRSP